MIRILLFTLIFISCSYADSKPKVGLLLPLTGELSLYGKKINTGIQLAYKNYQDKIDLVIEDGKSSTKDAVAAYHKLVNIDKIDYLFGPFGPGETLAVASRAKKDNLLVISISLCSDKYQEYKNVFCIYPGADKQTEPMQREFLKEEYDIQRAVIIFEESEIHHYFIKEHKLLFAKKGIEDYKIFKYQSGHDFATLVLKAQKLKPDLLIIAGNPSDSLQIAKAIKRYKFKPKYVWYETEYDENVVMDNKDFLEGFYISGLPYSFDQKFGKLYKAEYGVAEDLYSAAGYDAALYLFEAITKFQEPKKFLLNSKLKNTANENYYFTQDRQVNIKLYAGQILSGKLKFINN